MFLAFPETSFPVYNKKKGIAIKKIKKLNFF